MVAIQLKLPRGHRPRRGVLAKRQDRQLQQRREDNPLVIYGVAIDQEAVDIGCCAAVVAGVCGEMDPDKPCCPQCGRQRQFYHERCSCGAVKPWAYADELPPGRARRNVRI